METTAAEIVAATQRQWADAFKERSWSRLADFYTLDAAFYGSTPELYRGRAGVLAYFQALPPIYVRATFGTSFLVLPAPGIIIASGPVTFDVADNGATRALPYRITQVLVEQAESWLIATHHASPRPS